MSDFQQFFISQYLLLQSYNDVFAEEAFSMFLFSLYVALPAGAIAGIVVGIILVAVIITFIAAGDILFIVVSIRKRRGMMKV